MAKKLRDVGRRFLDAFGPLGGLWFAEGRTFAEASTLHTLHLKAEAERLTREKERLAAENEHMKSLLGWLPRRRIGFEMPVR